MAVLRIRGDLGRLSDVGWALLATNQAYNALYVLHEYDSFPPRFLVEFPGRIIQSIPGPTRTGDLVPNELSTDFGSSPLSFHRLAFGTSSGSDGL